MSISNTLLFYYHPSLSLSIALRAHSIRCFNLCVRCIFYTRCDTLRYDTYLHSVRLISMLYVRMCVNVYFAFQFVYSCKKNMYVANTSTHSPKTTHTRTHTHTAEYSALSSIQTYAYFFKIYFKRTSPRNLRPPHSHTRTHLHWHTHSTPLELIFYTVIVASCFHHVSVCAVWCCTQAHKARMHAYFWFSIMIVMRSFCKAQYIGLHLLVLIVFSAILTPFPLYLSLYVSSLILCFFFFFCRFIVMLMCLFRFHFSIDSSLSLQRIKSVSFSADTTETNISCYNEQKKELFWSDSICTQTFKYFHIPKNCTISIRFLQHELDFWK